MLDHFALASVFMWLIDYELYIASLVCKDWRQSSKLDLLWYSACHISAHVLITTCRAEQLRVKFQITLSVVPKGCTGFKELYEIIARSKCLGCDNPLDQIDRFEVTSVEWFKSTDHLCVVS